jgi:hypothetical protein
MEQLQDVPAAMWSPREDQTKTALGDKGEQKKRVRREAMAVIGVPGASLYHEEQRFRQWWVWLAVVAVAALAWWTLIQQILRGRPFGDSPVPVWGAWLVWLLVGVGLPTLFLGLKMVTDVTSGQVVIRYRPLSRRVIRLDEIEQVTARTYAAIKEYGGWGIKGWSRRNIAYNVSGYRGAQLVLKDGRRVMLGSQRPDELAQVIETQLRELGGRAG